MLREQCNEKIIYVAFPLSIYVDVINLMFSYYTKFNTSHFDRAQHKYQEFIAQVLFALDGKANLVVEL